MAKKALTESVVPVNCSYSELVATDKLVPYPGNPNQHPPKQILLLSKIIAAQGWRSPIIVSNLSGRITKGHGRWMAAKQLGLEVVPVDFQDYESERQEKEDLLADNRLSELSIIDREELKDMLLDLDTEDLDLDLTGYLKEDLEIMMTDFSTPDYGILGGDGEADGRAEEMSAGVKRGLVIEFEKNDYDQAARLCKLAREQDVYIGKVLIDALETQLADMVQPEAV